MLLASPRCQRSRPSSACARLGRFP